MTPEQITFLEANKHYWTEYKANKVIKHYDMQLRKELFTIARTFDTKANFCLHCSDDAANLLKYVYTQYEKMPKEPEEKNQEEGVMKMTFPVTERPTSDTNQAMEENNNISFTKKRGRKPNKK